MLKNCVRAIQVTEDLANSLNIRSLACSKTCSNVCKKLLNCFYVDGFRFGVVGESALKPLPEMLLSQPELSQLCRYGLKYSTSLFHILAHHSCLSAVFQY